MRQNLTARVPSLPVGAGRWRGLRCSIAAAAATLVAGALAPVSAADALGAPGGASAWTTGAKQGLGTSTTPQSKVWYTIARGVCQAPSWNENMKVFSELAINSENMAL